MVKAYFYNSEVLRPLVGKDVVLCLANKNSGALTSYSGILEEIPVIEDDFLPGHVWLRNGDKRTMVLTLELQAATERENT